MFMAQARNSYRWPSSRLLTFGFRNANRLLLMVQPCVVLVLWGWEESLGWGEVREKQLNPAIATLKEGRCNIWTEYRVNALRNWLSIDFMPVWFRRVVLIEEITQNLCSSLALRGFPADGHVGLPAAEKNKPVRCRWTRCKRREKTRYLLFSVGLGSGDQEERCRYGINWAKEICLLTADVIWFVLRPPDTTFAV